jgi:signal transduction histidine kinase
VRNFVAAILANADRFLSERSRTAILFACLICSIAIGGLDYHGSSSLLIVYLVPMSVAAWYGGSSVGLAVALWCATAWFLAGEFASQFSSVDAVAVWSFVARLAIFLTISRVLSRLRETMRLQNELTQFIVHDLRSPISSAITGLMTLQQSSEHLDETDKEMVNLALVSNQRALALVNSMLDVSKLETGKMELNLEHVSLDELVDAAIQQVALWALGQEIKIVPDVQSPNAVLDPDLTTRVIVNLLSNALKYSPVGGEVIVSVHSGFGGGLRFFVQDHGPGIPPEYVQSIFEPFNQVKGTKGGTGLGLTFCRLAVQAQGGKIWAESALGKGTKMIFTLPSHEPRTRREAHEPEPENRRVELPGGNRPRPAHSEE